MLCVCVCVCVCVCQSINQASLQLTHQQQRSRRLSIRKFNQLFGYHPPSVPPNLTTYTSKISSKNPQMSSLHLPLSANIEVLRPSRESIGTGGKPRGPAGLESSGPLYPDDAVSCAHVLTKARSGITWYTHMISNSLAKLAPVGYLMCFYPKLGLSIIGPQKKRNPHMNERQRDKNTRKGCALECHASHWTGERTKQR